MNQNQVSKKGQRKLLSKSESRLNRKDILKYLHARRNTGIPSKEINAFIKLKNVSTNFAVALKAKSLLVVNPVNHLGEVKLPSNLTDQEYDVLVNDIMNTENSIVRDKKKNKSVQMSMNIPFNNPAILLEIHENILKLLKHLSID